MKNIHGTKQRNNLTNEVMERESSLAIEELLMHNQTKFIQETVNTEAEAYLGRKWYEHGTTNRGYRNGSYDKKVRLPGGSIVIRKPHFRNTKEKFVSKLLKGIALLTDKIRMLALEMYVRGLSTRDIEATLREPNGKPMFSRSMISTLSERLYEQYLEFTQRDLSQFDIVYLFVDGVYESVRRYTDNQTLLCAWAICSDGSKVFLHLAAVQSESAQAWMVFFDDMTKRGLRQPLLVVSDGASGIISAIDRYFPKADRQRCIAHKLRNIAAKLPRDVQSIILDEIKSIYYAPTLETANLLAGRLIETYASTYASAMQCFSDDLSACLAT